MPDGAWSNTPRCVRCPSPARRQGAARCSTPPIAAATLIPFYDELAGANPVIVTPAAARERSEVIAKGLIDSVLLGHGQFCTRPGLVFVPADKHGDGLLDRINADVSTRTAGPLLTGAIQANFSAALDSLTHLPQRSAGTRDPPTGLPLRPQ